MIRRAVLERTQKIFNSHSDLFLLLRDPQSLDLAREGFTATSLLCPDMALSLGVIARPSPPEVEVVWLGRTDKESPGAPAPTTQPGIERTDWLEETPTALREKCQHLTDRLRLRPDEWASVGPSLSLAYDLLAEERLRRGCRILSRGKLVVSDRLHAHILSLLMGIPHLLLDNSYGKLKHFYDSWTREGETARWARSPEDVIEKVLGDPDFRMVLKGAGVELAGLDRVATSLSARKSSGEGWATGEGLARRPALAQRAQLERDVLAFVPAKHRFILVDDDQVRVELSIGDRIALPFLERDGQYWGPPADDTTAIHELERLREAGASCIAFAWPAFWWLDYYSDLRDYLTASFPCLLKNESVTLYDLMVG